MKEKDFSRVAEIFMPGAITSGDLFENEDNESDVQKAQLNPSIDPLYALEDDWRKSEIPAAGGHGNGKSLAECMALVANNGEFNIVNNGQSELINVIITDIQGKTIYNKQHNFNKGSQQTINLDGIENGVYLVKLTALNPLGVF